MSKLRITLIGLLIAAVVLVVGVTVRSRGEADPRPTASVAAPDGTCLDAWNAAADEVELGRHAATDHGAETALVLRLDFDGTSDAKGACTVVFPTPAFGDRADDPAHVARIQNGDVGWQPVRDLPAVSPRGLRELQAAARERANAALASNGSLSPRVR